MHRLRAILDTTLGRRRPILVTTLGRRRIRIILMITRRMPTAMDTPITGPATDILGALGFIGRSILVFLRSTTILTASTVLVVGLIDSMAAAAASVAALAAGSD